VTGTLRRTRSIAGQPAAWLEAGAGPPLVLVHGAGGSAELWPRQLDGLTDAARMLAPDLPGHGPLGGRGRPTVAAYAEWLDGFLGAVVGEPAVLVGHSMGGAIAQALALLRPERLAGLVLIATGARLRVAARLVELLRHDPRRGQSLIQDLSFGAAAPLECGELVARVLREGPPLVTLRDYLACDRFDVRDRLASIRTPTLVVAGAEDRLTPLRYARFLAEAIPGARLVEIEAAGHFPQLEQPGPVNAAIRAFLAARPEAATAGRAGARG
jgi:pimeloyl-ACP methyl ester carboxylesterase